MTVLNHKNCGGDLIVDLSTRFALVSPSYTLLSDGKFRTGMSELIERSGEDGIVFLCSKCKKTVQKPYTEVTCRCNVCREVLPVSEMRVYGQISQICVGCCEELRSGKALESDRSLIREYASYISGLPSSKIRNMIEILNTKISA